MTKAEQWHRESGIPYPFPNLNGPGWLPIIEQPHGALGLKLQLEVFLWLDHHAPKATQAKTLLSLESGGVEAARSLHLDEAVCWLPPTLEPSFGPRLARRGWRRSPWSCWSRQLVLPETK